MTGSNPLGELRRGITAQRAVAREIINALDRQALRTGELLQAVRALTAESNTTYAQDALQYIEVVKERISAASGQLALGDAALGAYERHL